MFDLILLLTNSIRLSKNIQTNMLQFLKYNDFVISNSPISRVRNQCTPTEIREFVCPAIQHSNKLERCPLFCFITSF